MHVLSFAVSLVPKLPQIPLQKTQAYIQPIQTADQFSPRFGMTVYNTHDENWDTEQSSLEALQAALDGDSVADDVGILFRNALLETDILPVLGYLDLPQSQSASREERRFALSQRIA